MIEADTNTVTRRRFLRGAAAAGATVVVGTSSVSAATGDHEHEEVPEDVTITDDPALIEPWQPRLVGAEQGDVSPLGTYAVRASSPDHDTDVIVAWTEYPYQDGYSQADSHAGDHEPVYVFFDPDTGDVTEVMYSAYHWARGSVLPGAVKLVDTSEGQQPVLRVVNPWHHHLPVPTSSTSNGRLYELRSLQDALSAWLTNGMSSALKPSQPYDPWTMKERGHWWRSNWGNELDHTLATTFVEAGFGGLPGFDLPRRDEAGLDE